MPTFPVPEILRYYQHAPTLNNAGILTTNRVSVNQLHLNTNINAVTPNNTTVVVCNQNK